MSPRLILFDIDGTLMKLTGPIDRAIRRVTRELFGMELSVRDVPCAGRTDPVIFRMLAKKAGLDEGRIEELMGKFHDIYPRYFSEEMLNGFELRIMPGISALMRRLSADEGTIIGVATGNMETIAAQKLQASGLAQFIKVGGYGSDAEQRSELLRIAIDRASKITSCRIGTEEVYYFGDTRHDITAGKDVGVVTVAVGTGYEDQDVLKKTEPDYYFKDLSGTNNVMMII